MHNGMMQLSGEKMSKSLGNLVTIQDFLAKHEADALRMMVLNTSYRHPLTYGEDVVEQAERGLERLRSGLRPALPAAMGMPGAKGAEAPSLAEAAANAKNAFVEAMDDDFNTASALAALFELVRQINQARDAGATNVQLTDVQNALRELSGVLGLRLERAEKDVNAAPFASLLNEIHGELATQGIEGVDGFKEGTTTQVIDSLLAVRVQLRAKKLWALSDKIRIRLGELGVLVEDSAGGSSWRWS
jgi:cysteinyl-tRNA synthetase